MPEALCRVTGILFFPELMNETWTTPEKTATAANKTTLDRTTDTFDLDILASGEKLGTGEIRIVMPHLRPRVSLGDNSK